LRLAKEGWPILSRNLDRIYALTQNMLAYSKHRELEIELAPLKPLMEELIRTDAAAMRSQASEPAAGCGGGFAADPD
jgi:hypothetical protein